MTDAAADLDNRTTPLGLFHYAHSYWASAVALSKTSPDCTHRDAPVNYLYFHAIELYLKSFLRLRGWSLARLKSDVRHGLGRAFDAAVAEGLPDDAETRNVVALIDANYIRSRYIETGAFTTASPLALWGVCRVLHGDIEPQINAATGLTRTRVIPFLDED